MFVAMVSLRQVRMEPLTMSQDAATHIKSGWSHTNSNRLAAAMAVRFTLNVVSNTLASYSERAVALDACSTRGVGFRLS